MAGRPPLNSSSTRFTRVGGAGAPPPAMAESDEVSYLWKFGDSTRSQLWVGTPTKVVTRSASISCSAFSASQRYIITSFIPLANADSMTGTQPVTWNRGTVRISVGGYPGVLGAGSPSWRTASIIWRQPKAIRACTTARWVDTAPFGSPVVPEV